MKSAILAFFAAVLGLLAVTYLTRLALQLGKNVTAAFSFYPPNFKLSFVQPPANALDSGNFA